MEEKKQKEADLEVLKYVETEKDKDKTVTLTIEDIKSLLSRKFMEGVHEEKKWHRKGMTLGTPDIPADPFYEDQVYQSGYEVTPYTFEEPKRITKGKKSKIRIGAIAESFGMSYLGRASELRGRGNKYLTTDQLFLIQDAAYLRVHTDPLGASISENFINFVIGRGVQVDCFIPEVEQVIKEFRKRNRMEEKDIQIVKHTFTSGEFFAKLKEGNDGNLYCYGISPQNVINVEHVDDDFETVLAFEVLPFNAWKSDGFQFYFKDKDDNTISKWIKSMEYDLYKSEEFSIKSKNEADFTTEEFIYFIKRGDFDAVRGDPPFRPILRSLRYAEDFGLDRMRLNHERSKVIMKKIVKAGAATQAKPQAIPKGGYILIATNEYDYEFMESHIKAEEAKEDGMWILHQIGAGVVLPVHILQQRADQGVYAAIKKMDSPFTQNILRWQDFFDMNWQRLDRFVLSRKIEANKLKPTFKVPAHVALAADASVEGQEIFREINTKIIEMVVEKTDESKMAEEIKNKIKKLKLDKTVHMKTENIPITRIFPDTVRENPLEMAKVLFLHRKMNLVSMATAARKAGYDWKLEMNQMLAEKETGVQPDDTDGNKSDEKIPKEPATDDNTAGTNIRMNFEL